VGQVAQLDASFQTKVAETGAMRTALARIGGQLEKEPEMVVTSSRYRSPFKQKLSDYQWELKEALTRYTHENPKIVRLQKRIETLEQLIAESKDEVAPENVYQPNPKRQELILRAQELEDQIKIAEAQSSAERRTLDESRTQLGELTGARAGYQDLVGRAADAERLVDILAARVAEVRAAMLRNESGFAIVERATPPVLPLPSMRKIVAVAGVVLGGGLGVLVALLLELRDPLVRTARDAQGSAGCELVFEVPALDAPEDRAVDPAAPTALVSVLFRRLANDLGTALKPREWRSLALVSADPHGGRTLMALNLASALGLKEERTLLVDADLRANAGTRPGTHLRLGAPDPEASLTEVLAGRRQLEDAVVPAGRPNLGLLATGPCETNEGLQLLGSRGFADLVRRLDRQGLHVVYDLPPLSTLESVTEAASAIGNVILVARSGQTRRQDLKQAALRLRAREVEIRAVAVVEVPEGLAAKP
jgi:Mrp family chromosome partitioning ATPase